MSKKNASVQKPSSSKAGGMKPEDLDRIVMSYLTKKGYNQSVHALKKESHGVSLDEFAFQSRAEAETDVSSHVLFYSTNENDAHQYDASFGKFTEWVRGSLDQYKPELRLVNYPLFVHCYLGLVGKGFTEESRRFMEKYSKEHMDNHGDEILRLSSVYLPQHIRENDLALNFNKVKFSLEMCSMSYELLTSFLHDNKLTLLLAIVNQHLDILVFNGNTLDENSLMKNSLTGGHETLVRENVQVLWGPLKEHPAVTLDKQDNLDGTNLNEANNNNNSHNNANNLAAVVAAAAAAKAKASASANQYANSPANDRIPFPKMTEGEINRRISALQEIRDRVKLGPASLPSACMYTFFNTNDRMNCLDISEDSTLMATGFADSHVRIWSLDGSSLYDMKKMDDLEEFEDKDDFDIAMTKDPATGTTNKTLLGHSGPVYGTKFSPDNQFLISCGEDATARLWSMDTFSNLASYKGHNYPIWDVDFSPAGSYFVTASHDRTARFWSTQYVHPLRIFAGHLNDVDCVKFHPNCNYVATGSSDKTCRLFDVQSGSCVRLFAGHTAAVCALAISPNGKYLASAGEDQIINIWDMGSGKKYGTFGGHESTIYSLSFSGDGAILASTSHDHTVRLWDFAGLGKTPRSSSLQLSVFPTKSTPVIYGKFTRKNVLLTAGCFTPKK